MSSSQVNTAFYLVDGTTNVIRQHYMPQGGMNALFPITATGAPALSFVEERNDGRVHVLSAGQAKYWVADSQQNTFEYALPAVPTYMASNAQRGTAAFLSGQNAYTLNLTTNVSSSAYPAGGTIVKATNDRAGERLYAVVQSGGTTKLRWFDYVHGGWHDSATLDTATVVDLDVSTDGSTAVVMSSNGELSVIDLDVPQTIGYAGTANAPVGASVSVHRSQGSGLSNYRLTGAPAGTTIDQATGTVYFGVQPQGSYQATVTADYSLGPVLRTVSTQVRLNVTPPRPWFTTDSVPRFTVGEETSFDPASAVMQSSALVSDSTAFRCQQDSRSTHPPVSSVALRPPLAGVG